MPLKVTSTPANSFGRGTAAALADSQANRPKIETIDPGVVGCSGSVNCTPLAALVTPCSVTSTSRIGISVEIFDTNAFAPGGSVSLNVRSGPISSGKPWTSLDNVRPAT